MTPLLIYLPHQSRDLCILFVCCGVYNTSCFRDSPCPFCITEFYPLVQLDCHPSMDSKGTEINKLLQTVKFKIIFMENKKASKHRY